MNTTTASLTSDLLAAFEAAGADSDSAALAVNALTEQQQRDTLESLRASAQERDQLRERLTSSPTLRAALCPATTWKTQADRFDVTRRAMKLTQGTADKHNVTLEALCEELVRQQGTIQGTIDMHGDDPRAALWGGTTFYAFRYRLKDALDELLSDARKAEALRKRTAQDEAWALQGLTRCERCDGQGGHASWPGFTCYACDGRCAL